MATLRVMLTTFMLGMASTGVAQTQGDPDLQSMEERLATLRLRFTDKHPEVMALLKQVEARKSNEVSAPPQSSGGPSELQRAGDRLAELRRIYTDKHPEVRAQIEIVEKLEQEKGE